MNFEKKINKIETKNNEVKDISVEEPNTEIEEKISIANDSTKPSNKITAIALTAMLGLGLGGGEKAVAAESIENPDSGVIHTTKENPRNSENILEETLVQMSKSSSDSAREFAADHKDTPTDILITLIDDPDVFVSKAAKINLENRKNVSPEILVQMSKSSDYAREFAADHKDTPTDILITLIDDPDVFVSKAAKINLENRKNVSPEILVQMSKSSDYAREFAADHKDTPTDILITLIDDPSSDVSIAAKINLENRKNVSPEILVQMSKSSDYAREFAADHKDTPTDILITLIDDPDVFVSKAAKINLENRQEKAS